MVTTNDRFGLIGKTVGGTFRVDDVIAEGGFGVVYRAFHSHFRAPVALKCLKIPEELSEQERQEFLERFRSEAEIQFRLSAHIPHIVRPLHVDAIHSDEGVLVPLMVLEWLEGQSFDTIIEERALGGKPPLSLSEAMQLIGPAAHALHQAHRFVVDGERLTIVHRDIKPDNLFVTEIAGKKIVKILDFGISKVRRAATQLAGHFSKTDGRAPFSPAYGAPEQWVPKRLGQTGPWTDVWGLALTLVEIIKGDPVILGDHQAMMGTILDPSARPSPRAEGVIVSDEVESVFLKALSVDPRYRYQTMEAFWESLQGALQISGDLTLGYNETPSGRHIALPRASTLPPMSAPTPWKSPLTPRSPLNIGDLPPMIAPGKIESTSEAPPPAQMAPSMPPPGSDLHPVIPAFTSWENFHPETPKSTEPPLTPPVSTREPSVKFELAPTSTRPLTPAIPKSPPAFREENLSTPPLQNESRACPPPPPSAQRRPSPPVQRRPPPPKRPVKPEKDPPPHAQTERESPPQSLQRKKRPAPPQRDSSAKENGPSSEPLLLIPTGRDKGS